MFKKYLGLIFVKNLKGKFTLFILKEFARFNVTEILGIQTQILESSDFISIYGLDIESISQYLNRKCTAHSICTLLGNFVQLTKVG